MARIDFTSLVNSIRGKVAGTTFQFSYGGFQIRSHSSPRDPKTSFQQLRRQWLAVFASSWRTLSNAERDTFIAAAPEPGGGFNLFCGCNTNLFLLGLGPISTFVSSPAPVVMPVEVTSYAVGTLEFKCTGPITTIPAGHQLLLNITFEQPESIYFFAPSSYSPISTFAAGTDLSVDTNVTADWESRFGSMQPRKRLCMYSSVINESNGLRSDSISTCQKAEEMLPYKYYYAKLFQSGTGAPTDFPEPSNTIGPVVWTRTSIGVYKGTASGQFTAGRTFIASTAVGSSNLTFIQITNSGTDEINITTCDSAGAFQDNYLSNLDIQVLVFI
jgi:hypothetical protein